VEVNKSKLIIPKFSSFEMHLLIVKKVHFIAHFKIMNYFTNNILKCELKVKLN